MLLLNPDTIVPAGAIDQLVARLDSQPEVAVVGPRIVDASGRAELSWGDRVTPWSERRRKTLAQRGQAGDPDSGRGHRSRHPRRPAMSPGSPGRVCWCADRTPRPVGLLDERYFLYMEDVDFCDAIRARGRRIRFEPSVEVVHLRGRSGPASGGAAERAWHASHLAYYRKHLPLWAPLLWVYQRLTVAGLTIAG